MSEKRKAMGATSPRPSKKGRQFTITEGERCSDFKLGRIAAFVGFLPQFSHFVNFIPVNLCPY